MGSHVQGGDNLALVRVAGVEGLHHAWASCRALDATLSLGSSCRTTEENPGDTHLGPAHHQTKLQHPSQPQVKWTLGP